MRWTPPSIAPASQCATLPGNFSPVNGSVGDGFIRLSEDFRVDKSGRPDLLVYKLNLAIVESAISRRDIGIEQFDERDYGVDLDNNGVLNSADTVAYWMDTRPTCNRIAR
jgi:hypothetical protein